MVRHREQYTLDPQVSKIVKRLADQYFNGNASKAAEHLLKQGIQAQRIETVKGLAYAGAGVATLLVLLVL